MKLFSLSRTIPFVLYLTALISLPSPSRAQSCSITDEKVLKRRRVQGIRANILGQLGLSEPPVVNRTAPVPKEIMDSFDALTAASESLSQERSHSCQSNSIYASPVSAFVGSINAEEVASTAAKRSAGTGPSNVLAEYKITFNFDLPSKLDNIRRAELLLYQMPPSVQNLRYRAKSLKEQYVEITAVYDALKLDVTVTGKMVDPSKEGFVAFNIELAAKNWIEQGVSGNVTLVVSVQCLSSPTCGHDRPHIQPVTFEDFDADMNAPRIIITSFNPLERTRAKRQELPEGSTPLPLCKESQVTCCLKPLNISFVDDLGFDFVASPESFNANYCDGICPIIDNMTPRVYEFLSLLSGNPAAAIEPCCAGNEFEEIQVLIANEEGQYEVETVKDVRVTSCKCA